MVQPNRLCYENVSLAALARLVAQCEELGARFEVQAEKRVCIHPSGTLHFEHVNDKLTVELVEDAGHFPPLMIIGGIRQAVEEAIEFVGREEPCHQQPCQA